LSIHGASAEGEGKRFGTCVWKLDIELSVDDGCGLADQLIQALRGDRAVACGVNVCSVSIARSHRVVEGAGRNLTEEAPREFADAGGSWRRRSTAAKRPDSREKACYA